VLIGYKNLQLVHVAPFHEPLKARDEIEVDVNRVLYHLDSFFQSPFQEFALFLSEQFIIVTESIRHRSELLILFVRSEIVIFEARNTQFSVEVVTLIFSSKGHKCLSFFIPSNIFFLFKFLLLLFGLENPKNSLHDSSPEHV
jgi:hypothetical protein